MTDLHINARLDEESAEDLRYWHHERGHGRILSTDQRDFHTDRWKHYEPFENLLLADT